MASTLTTQPAATAAPRLSARARLVLILLCAAQFAISIDFSILNVALPSLGRDLGLAEANLQWGVTAFALPSGGFLLLAGRLGDLVGRRRMFLVGLSVFAVASLAATLAVDPATFLAARAVQGLGAAVTIPTAMALLTTTFAEGPARNRALGVSGMVLSLGFTLGMLLGGALTSALGWRSTMALNVVMALPVLVAAPLLLTESRRTDRPRLDLPGAITVTGGLLALIYAVSTAAETSWTRPDVLVTLVAAVLLFGAFVLVESRSAEPLVSLAVLRRRTVAVGNLGGLVTFAMASALTFLLTLYLQQIRQLSPFESGLVFGVTGLGAASVGLIASRLVDRYGSRTVLIAGLTVQGVATAVQLAIGAHGGVWLVLVFCTITFGGHMAAVVSYGITATSGLSNTEQGLATGLLTTAQQVGLTAGIPILSALYAAHSAGLRAAGASPVDAMLGGIHRGILVAALVALAAALVIAVLLHRRTSR
ncbi:MFS transporter [Actinocatenispora sera]|uniref:MFS transporter n=1 Tax=Actinocatenispora sera TaxID=390989 RepID=A0A810KYD4_9ACTN|nr:MFS transporter [Actinocatenispora sera]BCJ27419.1 MFS transporter [Actinocatenispora sera]